MLVNPSPGHELSGQGPYRCQTSTLIQTSSSTDTAASWRLLIKIDGNLPSENALNDDAVVDSVTARLKGSSH